MGSDSAFVAAAACDHNPDFECAPCTTERHALAHPETVDGCVFCKYASIQISPAATPSKPRRIGKPREAKNSWEKGIVRDDRGMPLLKGVGEPIGVKEYAENRHKIEARRAALRSGTTKE